MEFENVNKDFTIDNLQKAFPDLIKENYAFRTDINVEYAGDIEPYLKDPANEFTNSALLVNGRYFSDRKRIDVEFEVYDIHSWELFEKKTFYCNADDMICLHDAFLIAVEESLSPYFVDEGSIPDDPEVLSLSDLTVPDIKQEASTPRETSATIYDDTQKNIFNELDDFAAHAEFNLDLKKPETDRGQYGNRYFREFHFTDESENGIPPVDDNTQDLINILDQFLTNPYDVKIGEMNVKFNDYDRDMVDVEVPIEYSVKSSLMQDLLTNIPHRKLINREGHVLLQFSNGDFRFEVSLVEKLALMKYQTAPIMYFTGEKGNLQFVMLDSWKKKYDGIEINDIPIMRQDRFTPLFAIKPGADNIQMNIDISSLLITYSFSVPYNTFGKYTKLTVKFLLESQLDQYLAVTYSNN